MEQTLVFIKPDGIEKKMVGAIITRFEKKGFTLKALKKIQLNEQILKEHYAHLVDKPFYPEIVKFMKRTPVVVMIWAGENAIDEVRRIIGSTDPKKANLGTIRGDLALAVDENLIHGSDSPENAALEIKRFFKDEEIF